MLSEGDLDVVFCADFVVSAAARGTFCLARRPPAHIYRWRRDANWAAKFSNVAYWLQRLFSKGLTYVITICMMNNYFSLLFGFKLAKK